MIILGLGSNVGNRLGFLQSAVDYLSDGILEIEAVSSIYESPAMLKDDAPESWNMPFFNIAITGSSSLCPQDMLIKIKEIENKIGRQKIGVWAPREIDIDIITYNNIAINEPNLKIPHPHLCQRQFVLLPIAEIAPHWLNTLEGSYKGKNAAQIADAEFSGDATTVKTAHKINLT